MTTKTQKIIELHKTHTAKELCELLNTNHSHVYGVAKRYRLRLKRADRLHAAKITHEQARAIQRDYRPLAVIAAEYGITPSCACQIRAGHRFALGVSV